MKLTPSEWEKRLGFEILDDRRYFQADWNKELTFDEFMNKADLSICSRHPDREQLREKLFVNKFNTNTNNFHLRVYKLDTITLESSSGLNVSLKMKEIWDAPFGDETNLLETIIGFSKQGFSCRVEKN